MFEIYVPTRLYFGLGALDQIHTMQLPGKHALVLISQGKSVVKAGYWDRLKQQLEETGVKASLFSAIQANPTTDSVMEAADMAVANTAILSLGLAAAHRWMPQRSWPLWQRIPEWFGIIVREEREGDWIFSTLLYLLFVFPLLPGRGAKRIPAA